MAGREKSYTDPSAGGAKAKRDEEGKYGLTCRYISGETEGATSGQAQKKDKKNERTEEKRKRRA